MDTLELLRLATLAPSADNSQPWAFTLEGDELVGRYGHPSNFKDPFGPAGHASLLAAGTLHENLHLLSAGQVETHLTPDDALTPWTLRIAPASIGEPTAEVRRGIEARHTDRHPFARRPLAALAELHFGCLPDPGIRFVTCTDAGRIQAVADALQLCSRARFNQPELHEWLFTSLRWNDEDILGGDGLDIHTLHLPPGGKLFMNWIRPWSRMEMLNRIGVDKIMAIADTAMVRQAPCVIALCGDSTPRTIWNAGRSLQRLWITLNGNGLAVHPYYAITDLGNRRRAGHLKPGWDAIVKRGEDLSAEALDLSPGERVHMLLRVGFPGTEPVRSKRRPPSSFLTVSR